MREMRTEPRPGDRVAKLIPTLPDPVRAVLRNAVWTYGRATSRMCLVSDADAAVSHGLTSSPQRGEASPVASWMSSSLR